MSGYELSIAQSIRGIPAFQWDALAKRPGISPFLEHAYLAACEESGSASSKEGWYPLPLLLKKDDELVGAAPVYGKTHSMGEFVFDQGIAQAVESVGSSYYPKLVATVPFTPYPGYRFLYHPQEDEETVTAILLSGLRQLLSGGQFHTASILFADPDWVPVLERAAESPRDPQFDSSSLDLTTWEHQAFFWTNRNYRDFHDFLSRFPKSPRRNIQRERKAVRDSGLDIRILQGDAVTPSLMSRMYDFYRSTNDQFGPFAAFFLNRDWFLRLGETWAHRLLLIGAWRDGEDDPVALSFLVEKDDLLVGRYWGSREFVKYLHFELCYYAPLEYAIAKGLKTFDPGMGSPHKAKRGFESRSFVSYHTAADSQIADFFRVVFPQINREERRTIQRLNASVPRKAVVQSPTQGIPKDSPSA